MGAFDAPSDVERWAEAGVDRLIVMPWRRSRDAVDGLRRFADLTSLTGLTEPPPKVLGKRATPDATRISP